MNGNATWKCFCPNEEEQSLEEMQEQGFEIGTTVNVIPNFETVISWAKQILGT